MIQRTQGGRPSRRDRGASLVEYAMLMALIAIVCLSALVYFGGQSKNSVGHSKDCIDFYTNNVGANPGC
jgi:Tfp pilus assembly protein PilX